MRFLLREELPEPRDDHVIRRAIAQGKRKLSGPTPPEGAAFASRLIENGESLAYVKGHLGHHSIRITVDTYGHRVPGANRKAVNALDDPGGYVDPIINAEPINSAQEIFLPA